MAASLLPITRAAYLMGRDAIAPLTPEMEANVVRLLEAVNALLAVYVKAGGEFQGVSSGYRPAVVNSKVPGAARKSAHMTAEAIDIRDPAGKLDQWCLANLPELANRNLYIEHPDSTPGWTHLQTRRPGSGNRVFRP